MPHNKNQHYVPQSYFNRFSIDGQTIEVFNLKLGKHISRPSSIKNQCSKDNFYGTNVEVDKIYSNLENESAPVIMKIIENENLTALDIREKTLLYKFLATLRMRTKKTKGLADELINHIFKFYQDNYLVNMEEFRKLSIPKELLKKIRVKDFSENERALKFTLYHLPLLFDLSITLLINQTNIDFIFSDAPVIFHNSFLNNSNISGKGFASTGLQIFMPLNNNLMLHLYDSKIYNIDCNKQARVFINNLSDILALNTLQYFYCFQNLYFGQNNTGNHVAEIYETNRDKRSEENIITKKKLKKDSVNEIIKFRSQNINYDFQVTFSKTIKQTDPILSVRNKELFEKVREYEKIQSQF